MIETNASTNWLKEEEEAAAAAGCSATNGQAWPGKERLMIKTL